MCTTGPDAAGGGGHTQALAPYPWRPQFGGADQPQPLPRPPHWATRSTPRRTTWAGHAPSPALHHQTSHAGRGVGQGGRWGEYFVCAYDSTVHVRTPPPHAHLGEGATAEAGTTSRDREGERGENGESEEMETGAPTGYLANEPVQGFRHALDAGEVVGQDHNVGAALAGSRHPHSLPMGTTQRLRSVVEGGGRRPLSNGKVHQLTARTPNLRAT